MIRESNADQILPNLWLGNALAAKNQNFLTKNDIKYVINVSCNIPNYFHGSLTYLNISINDDDVTISDVSKIFEITNNFIYQAYKNNDAVLVHCKRGHHKSAAVVAAFLIKHLKMDADTAIRYINSLRRNTFTRETNMTKGLRKYYFDSKKELYGGASSDYINYMTENINKLSDDDAKFWYDVFVEIMNIHNNQYLKGEYGVQDANKAKFKSIHHFFTFGIFDNIINNMSRNEIMKIYIDGFRWNNYINFNDKIHWVRLLLNYRDLKTSSFAMPDDEFIAGKFNCLNEAVVDDPKETLKNLFWCLVNINVKTNVNTNVNTNFNN